MDIELHAAKISEISDFIKKLHADGETTIQSIQQKNKEIRI